MMKCPAALLSLVLLACPCVAAPMRCGTPEQRASKFREVIEQVDGLREFVEKVPPSEEEFLFRELREARFQPGRHKLVKEHRYYPALRLHFTVDVTVAALEKARGSTKVVDQADTVLALVEEFTELAAAVNEYLDADGRRPQPVLPPARTPIVRLVIEHLPGSLMKFARCLVGELKEP